MMKQGGAVYIKEEGSYMSNFSEILNRCFPEDELDKIPNFVSKILAKEHEIVATISRVDIKAVFGPDKMKQLTKGVLDCIGVKEKFNVKPYTGTTEFRILETIVLSVFLRTFWYVLKSISKSEFEEKYTKLLTMYASEKCDERRDFETLFHFRNVLCVATMLIPPKNNKDRLIALTTRIIEGLGADGKPIRYVNGSGKKKGTIIRHEIFELEMISNFESKNEGIYDVKLSVLSSFKRKFDVVDPEPPIKRGKGRPPGSKNKKDTASTNLTEVEAPITFKQEPTEFLAANQSPYLSLSATAAAVHIKNEIGSQNPFLQPSQHNPFLPQYVSSTRSHFDDTSKFDEDMEWLDWNLQQLSQSCKSACIPTEFDLCDINLLGDPIFAGGVSDFDNINCNTIFSDNDTNSRQPSNSSEEFIFDLSPLSGYSDDLGSF
jgi:hypothetical protein